MKSAFISCAAMLAFAVTVSYATSAAYGFEPLTPSSIVNLAAKKDAVSHSGFFWVPNTHTIVYSQVANVKSGSWIYSLQFPSGTKHKLLPGENPLPSPDGKHLVFMRLPSSSNGPRIVGNSGFQLWVADVDGGNARQLTHATHGICDYGQAAWSPDSRQIAYITCSFTTASAPATKSPDAPTVVVAFPVKPAGEMHYAVHIIDLSSGGDRVLLRHQGEFGDSLTWLDLNTLLYQHDNGKPTRYMRSSLSTIALDTGRVHTVLSGYQWQAFYHPAVDVRGKVIAFRADAHETSWFPSRNEIGILRLKTGKIHLLPFSRNSVGSAMQWTPDGKWLLYSDGPSTQLELIATDGAGIHRQVTFGDGVNTAPVFSSDGRYIAWLYNNGTGTTSLHVGAWRNGSIGASRSIVMLTTPLAGIAAGKTEVVRWKSFDGTQIDGYLTLPVNRHGGHYPTVVIVHGGAIFRNTVDEPEWPGEIYFIEYLAQRGYAVFQPDYRESGNFGYDLLLHAYARRDPLKEDFADISSGIDTLEHRGIADPSRLYLLGHSYGSVVASWIITHSALFRAAVSYEGSDFFYDWSVFAPGFSGPNLSLQWSMGNSTPLTQPAAWAANSGVLNAAKARTPTLFINGEHGINAPSLPWLAGALRSKGVDAQYVLYKGEGHVVLQPANQIDLVNRILHWITSH